MTTPASISIVREEAGQYAVSHDGERSRRLLRTGPHSWVLSDPGQPIDVAHPGHQFKSKAEALKALAAGLPPADSPGSDFYSAGELAVEEIGSIISFNTELSGGVHAVVTGELRQIYHTGSETVINVCSAVRDVSGDLAEFQLNHSDQVEVRR